MRLPITVLNKEYRMKQFFIRKNNTPVLTLFFAGWGMDEHPFLSIPTDNDWMLCYDYRSLSFDAIFLQQYDQIEVVAWSMGVWAAEQILRDNTLNISGKIAINGTPFPVDNEKGIPEKIAISTLQQLNESNLQKFYRRMCSSGEAYSEFVKTAPRRSLTDITEELAGIYKLCQTPTETNFVWDAAYIGTNDLIFPPENQRRAWQKNTKKIREVVQPHYSRELLNEIVFK